MAEEVKKEGLTFEEKLAQVENTTASKSTLDIPNDDEILNPSSVECSIGDRLYTIKPLVLSQMKYLVKLSKVNLNDFTEETINTITECLGVILKEKDASFLEENLDIPTMMVLFEIIQRINYKGIPAPKKADTKKAGN